MSKKSKQIVVIAGPTAVGKTSLAIKVAQHLKTVIISADSRQFYKEMHIGTAKPAERELETVKHYFIDHLSIHDNYSVAQFERDVLKLLNELFNHHQQVVVVGGAGLYIKALCEGLDEMPVISDNVREKWNHIRLNEELTYLQEQVRTVDPDYYETVDKQNPIRLTRAMEVYEASGKNMTFWRNQTKPIERPFDVIKIGLNRPREELYQRIDQRMDIMIADGLFEEAEKLYAHRHLNALQTVGYAEIFGFLDGEYKRSEAIRLLKRNSRRYAKRQITWFKKDDAFRWFHPDNMDEILTYVQ